MKNTKQIAPSEIHAPIKGHLYDEAISFINEVITNRKWHEMISEKQEIQNNYNAIILSPAGKYTSVMNLVEENFKTNGWDCFHSYAYDGRGPHHCFYVNKKHFSK